MRNFLQGSTFATICEMTDVFEGSIVRFMRRLDELLNQLIKAATVSIPMVCFHLCFSSVKSTQGIAATCKSPQEGLA